VKNRRTITDCRRGGWVRGKGEDVGGAKKKKEDSEAEEKTSVQPERTGKPGKKSKKGEDRTSLVNPLRHRAQREKNGCIQDW